MGNATFKLPYLVMSLCKILVLTILTSNIFSQSISSPIPALLHTRCKFPNVVLANSNPAVKDRILFYVEWLKCFTCLMLRSHLERGPAEFVEFYRFTIRCATSDWLRRGQNSHCIMEKCRQTNAAKCEITLEHVSDDLQMRIKRFQTKIHNEITINIHNRSIYFKIITCIILG